MLPQVRHHASACCNVPPTVLFYLLAHTERGVEASDQSQKEKNKRGPKATPDFPIIDGVAETLAAWSTSSVDSSILCIYTIGRVVILYFYLGQLLSTYRSCQRVEHERSDCLTFYNILHEPYLLNKMEGFSPPPSKFMSMPIKKKRPSTVQTSENDSVDLTKLRAHAACKNCRVKKVSLLSQKAKLTIGQMSTITCERA
jgi:hypothetical protein